MLGASRKFEPAFPPHMIEAAYLAVASIGLLHGLEPGHGWPVAMLYASGRPHPLTRAFFSGWIISIAHLVSSMAVVAAYVLLKAVFSLSIPYINIIAGGALVVLAVRFLMEKPKTDLDENHGHLHDDFEGRQHSHPHTHSDGSVHIHRHKHSKRVFLSLASIGGFALILGFAHEEEFALLALAVGGVDPLILMLTYAFAVMAALISISVVSVIAYSQVQSRLKKYEYLIPKVSGLILLLTAATFLLGLR